MNFIQEDFLDDLNICDQLIDLHKNSHDKHKGCSGEGVVQSDIKLSTDVTFSPYNTSIANIECMTKYFSNLQRILQKYVEEYKFCNEGNPFLITDNFNIQHYKPNEGYFAWHFERTVNNIISSRML
jgi:hypothetical protein